MSAVGAYFAKKRWNPGNLKNVEEVWKREQAKKEEEKKVEQLRREYEEDRNREALEELQVRAGVKKTSARLNWMYDAGPSAGAADSGNRAELDAKEREAFLLGEKSIDEIVREPKVNISKNSKQREEVEVLPSFSQAEMFVRTHEDPLILIKKRQEAMGFHRTDEDRVIKSSKKTKREKKHKSSKKKKSHRREQDEEASLLYTDSSNSDGHRKSKELRDSGKVEERGDKPSGSLENHNSSRTSKYGEGGDDQRKSQSHEKWDEYDSRERRPYRRRSRSPPTRESSDNSGPRNRNRSPSSSGRNTSRHRRRSRSPRRRDDR